MLACDLVDAAPRRAHHAAARERDEEIASRSNAPFPQVRNRGRDNCPRGGLFRISVRSCLCCACVVPGRDRQRAVRARRLQRLLQHAPPPARPLADRWVRIALGPDDDEAMGVGPSRT